MFDIQISMSTNLKSFPNKSELISCKAWLPPAGEEKTSPDLEQAATLAGLQTWNQQR